MRVGICAVLACAVSLSLVLVTPAIVSAQGQVITLDQYDGSQVRAGVLRASVDTNARLDPSATEKGTPISFENDLGLSDSETVFNAQGTWRLAQKHNIDFSYWGLDRSATTHVRKTVQFGDLTFPVDATVHSIFDTKYGAVMYRYTCYQDEQFRLGVGAGVGLLKVNGEISTSAELSGRASAAAAVETQSIDETVPVPEFGVKALAKLADNVFANAHINFLSLNVGSVGGRVRDMAIGVDYMPDPHWTVGAGWMKNTFVVTGDGDSFRGRVDYGVKGLTLYGSYIF
jgi:hypothetical protein